MSERKTPRVSIRKMVEPDLATLNDKLDHPAWGDPMTKFDTPLPKVLSPDEFGRELALYVKKETESNISPFYKYMISGKMPLSGVQEWARQHYFDVRCFTTTIAQVVANSNYQYDIRHVFGLNLVEEMGDLFPVKEHPLLFQKFGRAIGVTDEEMEFVKPIPEMLISMEYRLKLVKELDAVTAVAAGSWALEATVAERHRKIAKAMKEHYGVSDDNLEFFYVHCGGLGENDYGGDWAHAGEALHFIKKYATTAESQERVRQAVWRSIEARKVCHWGLFRHIVLANNPNYNELLQELSGPTKKVA